MSKYVELEKPDAIGWWWCKQNNEDVWRPCKVYVDPKDPNKWIVSILGGSVRNWRLGDLIYYEWVKAHTPPELEILYTSKLSRKEGKEKKKGSKGSKEWNEWMQKDESLILGFSRQKEKVAGRLDRLIYRLFYWRWNKIFKRKPGLGWMFAWNMIEDCEDIDHSKELPSPDELRKVGLHKGAQYLERQRASTSP